MLVLRLAKPQGAAQEGVETELLSCCKAAMMFQASLMTNLGLGGSLPCRPRQPVSMLRLN
jgi:hypothetical protein